MSLLFLLILLRLLLGYIITILIKITCIYRFIIWSNYTIVLFLKRRRWITHFLSLIIFFVIEYTLILRIFKITITYTLYILILKILYIIIIIFLEIIFPLWNRFCGRVIALILILNIIITNLFFFWLILILISLLHFFIILYSFY